jgi:hypothetical protein
MNHHFLKTRHFDRSVQRAVEKSASPHKATSQRTGRRFAFACSLPTSQKNDIKQKPHHLDRRRRSCRRSGEIPAFRFSNRNALQRATESTESIDTHDKMETDTNQSGASRTAPFNALVFHPKSRLKVSSSKTLRTLPREGEAP